MTIIPGIIHIEMLYATEEIPLSEKWEDFPIVFPDKPVIWFFIPVGSLIFHAIFLVETFNLSMSEHWKTGECG